VLLNHRSKFIWKSIPEVKEGISEPLENIEGYFDNILSSNKSKVNGEGLFWKLWAGINFIPAKKRIEKMSDKYFDCELND
jgi:hypothetical protein